MSEEQITGTSNVTYNLVSVIYHALQGAETYDQYVTDAERNNDTAAANLFRDVKSQHQKIADQAEELLAERLSKR